MREKSGARRACAVVLAAAVSCILSFFSFIPNDAHAAQAQDTSASQSASSGSDATGQASNPWIQYEAIAKVSSINTHVYEKGYTGSIVAPASPCAADEGTSEEVVVKQGEKYDFAGWSYNSAGETVVVKPGQEIDDPPFLHVLYGVWQEKPYELSYDGNGGTSVSGSTIVKEACTYSEQECLVDAASSSFTRDGYKLSSWNTRANGMGKSYAVGKPVALTGNVTLYAQWTLNVATVKFDMNGGTGSIASVTANVGNNVILSSHPTRAGYTFSGWNMQADGTGAVTYAPGSSFAVPTEGATLYAQWKANTASITFNPNGGTGFSVKMIGHTDQMVSTLPVTFARDGYTFKNWNTAADGSGTSYGVGDAYVLHGDMTLYAQWEATTPGENEDVPAQPQIPTKTLATTTITSNVVTIVVPEEVVAPSDDSTPDKTDDLGTPKSTINMPSDRDSKADGKSSPYDGMHVQDDTLTQTVDTESGYEKKAGVLVGVASALFVGVAAAFFPFGSATAAAGVSKLSLIAKIGSLLHR